MSQISGATYPIYAPLMLDDPAAAQSLRSEPRSPCRTPRTMSSAWLDSQVAPLGSGGCQDGSTR